MSYVTYVGVLLLQLTLLAQATDILGGHSGRIGVGAVVFAGIGGFAYAAAIKSIGIAPGGAAIVAISAGAVLAAAVAPILMALRPNDYLLSTIAAQLALMELANNTTWVGGPLGIANVPSLALRALPDVPPMYPEAVGLGLLVIAIAVAGSRMLIRPNSVGEFLHWLRDDDISAEAFGVPKGRMLFVVFVLHALMGTACGISMVAVQGYVAPQSFGLELSLSVLAVVYLSGTGGAPVWMLAGGLVMVSVGEILRALGGMPDIVGPVQRVVLDLVLIVVLLGYRRGFAGPILGTGPSSTESP